MMEQRTGELYDALNDICTYLVEGQAWHLKAANECRGIAIRGIGRWHDKEAEGDFNALDPLVKLLGDRLNFKAKIAYPRVERSQNFEIRNIEEFAKHFHVWIDRENEFLKALNFAVSKSGAVDMSLYQCLCKLTKEVQDEAMRARMVYDSMDFAGWNPHDISVKSKWIHEYFEHDYKPGEDINFNIG